MSRWKNDEPMEFDVPDEQEVRMLICSPDVLDLQNHKYSPEQIIRMEETYNKYFRHFGVLHLDKRGRYYDLPNSDLSRTWANSWDDDILLLNSMVTSNSTVINNQEIPRGSWIMDVKVIDDNLWQKIKNKELNSASLGGMTLRLPANSHQEIVGGFVSEISLVKRGANNQNFLLLKGIDLEPILAPYPNFHSCSVKDKNLFDPASFRNIESKEGRVQLIIGRLEGESTTTIQSIRYPISKYSESAARKNCQSKKGTFEPAKKKG